MTEREELDSAVDEFAAEMKMRLHSKRKQGWTGWQNIHISYLDSRLLKNAAQAVNGQDKKSMIDVANLAMMLFRRKQIAELADWTPDFDMTGVSVSDADKANGSPRALDKIARNPKNHDDKWLVAAQYFADNFEPIAALTAAQPENEQIATYPNLLALAQGCMSGQLSEYPQLRIEAKKILAYIADAQPDAEPVADTGNPEADRVISRLMSSDPEFQDCSDAALLIRKLVVEHKGPEGFATWKDAAIHERMLRVNTVPPSGVREGMMQAAEVAETPMSGEQDDITRAACDGIADLTRQLAEAKTPSQADQSSGRPAAPSAAPQEFMSMAEKRRHDFLTKQKDNPND
jgi:hypothetical protein